MTAIVRTPARELTDQERKARAALCFELDQSIKASLRAGREAVWDAAKQMHLFDEEEGWTALGYDRVNEWLADPEVGMSRSSFYRMVKLYREMVVIRQLPEEELKTLEPSKLEIALPAIKENSKPLAEVLDDVKELGSRDLRELYFRKPDPKDDVPPPDGGESLTAETDDGDEDEDVIDATVVKAVLEVTDALDAAESALRAGWAAGPEALFDALESLVAAVKAPTEGEWLAMQERSQRRRRPVRSLAESSGWTLVGDEADRFGWQVAR